ncbi:MAG: GNAT family N-acetyltransferase [Pseudomonadota bacterium]
MMKIVTDDSFMTTLRWFRDETELRQWAGPNFRFPFDEQSFKADLTVKSLASRVLLSEQQELLAFGQYYGRLDRCHLGRLAVSPEHRGQGVAATLMGALIDEGRTVLDVAEASLFVLANHESALRAYRRFGFGEADYPEQLPLENCLYLTYQDS